VALLHKPNQSAIKAHKSKHQCSSGFFHSKKDTILLMIYYEIDPPTHTPLRKK
jgi:hypothetical protein